MTQLVYEHPLNEKLRTYLRLEAGLSQLRQQADLSDDARQQGFFSSLFAVLETIDRNDIRPDLLKDIERCEHAMVEWSEHPAISDEALKGQLQLGVRMQSELFRGNRLGGNLKDDKFLAPLRQRFLIPGGSCFFDLPQLQFWYALPLTQRLQQVQEWLQELQLAEQAVRYVLSFIRARGQFVQEQAIAGFYQSGTEQFELLRLQYDINDGCYPTISGNRYRYAIRFMQLCDAQGRTSTDKTINFALARC